MWFVFGLWVVGVSIWDWWDVLDLFGSLFLLLVSIGIGSRLKYIGSL